MSKNTIGWIDRDKMRAALAALRENQQKNRAPRAPEAPANDDLIDLFGERAPLFRDDNDEPSFVQEPTAPHTSQPRDDDARQQAAAEQEAARQAAEDEARQQAAAEQEAARQAAEDEARRKAAEDEARRKAAEDEARRKAAEDEARRKAAEDEARRKAAEDEARSLAAFYEAVPNTATVAHEQSETDQRPPRTYDEYDQNDDAEASDDPVDRSLFAALSLLRNHDSRGTPYTAPHPSDDAGYEPAFPDLHRSSSAAARHAADTLDHDLDDETLSLTVRDVDLQLGQSAVSFATLAPLGDAPATSAPTTGRNTLRLDEYVPFQDFDFDSDDDEPARAEKASSRESAMAEALHAIDHALDLALPPSVSPDDSAHETFSAPPTGGRPTAITVEIDVPASLRFTPPTVGSTVDDAPVEDDPSNTASPPDASSSDSVQGNEASDEDTSIEGESDEDTSIEGASDEDTSIEGASDEDTSIEGESDEDTSIEGASDEDAGYFLLMGAPPTSTPVVSFEPSSGADSVPLQAADAPSSAVAGPRIATEFLATLRWRQMPPIRSEASVLAWLQSVCAWLTTQDDVLGAFAADEAGLPIATSLVDDDTVAIAVAMRQAMARVHALQHDVSYGHSLYRHAAQQFVHVAWAASDHGVLTVGVVSTKPLAEGLMDTLTQALESSVQGQSFV